MVLEHDPLRSTPQLNSKDAATILKQDALERWKRYGTEGASAMVVSNRPRNALRPNTQFLHHLVQAADSHNQALLQRESKASKARLKGLSVDDDKKAGPITPVYPTQTDLDQGNVWAGARGWDKPTATRSSGSMQDSHGRDRSTTRPLDKNRKDENSERKRVERHGKDNEKAREAERSHRHDCSRVRDQHRDKARERDHGRNKESERDKDRDRERDRGRYCDHCLHREMTCKYDREKDCHDKSHCHKECTGASRSSHKRRRHRSRSRSRSRSPRRRSDSRERSRRSSPGSKRQTKEKSESVSDYDDLTDVGTRIHDIQTTEGKRTHRSSRHRGRSRDRRSSSHDRYRSSSDSPAHRPRKTNRSPERKRLRTEHDSTNTAHASKDGRGEVPPKVPQVAPGSDNGMPGPSLDKISTCISKKQTTAPQPSSKAARASATTAADRFASLSSTLKWGDPAANSDSVIAFRSRMAWKQASAKRMRDAGYSESQIDTWEKTGEMDTEVSIEDIKWTKRGQTREWDRGKVLDEGGNVVFEADWNGKGAESDL